MIRKETVEEFITSDGSKWDTFEDAQSHEIFQSCLDYFTDLILPDYCDTEKLTSSQVHEVSNLILENKEFILKVLSENVGVKVETPKATRECSTCMYGSTAFGLTPCERCSRHLLWVAK